MRVTGVKNSPQPLEWVDHVYGPAEMEEVFKQSDYVINLLHTVYRWVLRWD